jgi:hypothetical protein
MTSNCQCGSHPPAKPEAVELAKLEAIVADCRARKAKAAPGTPMPLIACLADKTAVREAITARLEASKASVAASAAKLKAQAAVAAVATAPKPAAPASRPPAKASGDTSRSARREAARTASTFSAGTAHTFSDALLSQAAVHRSSPESDRAIATAELEKRGFTVSPSGVISKSTVKPNTEQNPPL